MTKTIPIKDPVVELNKLHKKLASFGIKIQARYDKTNTPQAPVYYKGENFAVTITCCDATMIIKPHYGSPSKQKELRIKQHFLAFMQCS